MNSIPSGERELKILLYALNKVQELINNLKEDLNEFDKDIQDQFELELKQFNKDIVDFKQKDCKLL